MPRIKQSIETSVMNDGGEIVSKRANKTLSWGEEDPYIKLYMRDVLYLSDIPDRFEKAMLALLKRMSYAGEEYGMCVILAPAIRKSIIKEVGWSNQQTLTNALNGLIKGKVLERLERNVYRFNPYLFGKGDWQDISRIRLEVNYDAIKGRTFKANLEFKEEKNGQLAMNFEEEKKDEKTA